MLKNKRIPLLLFCLFIIYFAVQYSESKDTYQELQSKLNNNLEKIEYLQQNKNYLSDELSRIETKEYVERIAREELGLVKEGETLLLIIEQH